MKYIKEGEYMYAKYMEAKYIKKAKYIYIDIFGRFLI